MALTAKQITEIQIKRMIRGQKHWSDYLPESGRMLELEAMVCKMMQGKISDTARHLVECEELLQREEKKLEQKALQHWTQSEINIAKERCKK